MGTEAERIDSVMGKFPLADLKSANICTIRDIFEHAAIYDKVYRLENIEQVTKDKDDWIQITINGKQFEIQYCGCGYQYRIGGRYARKEDVVSFLVNGTNETVERYGRYKHIYKAILDKDRNAITLFKDAVDHFDWFYQFSDDYGVVRGGENAEGLLVRLAGLLGKEAEAYYQEQHDCTWNRVKSS